MKSASGIEEDVRPFMVGTTALELVVRRGHGCPISSLEVRA